MKIRWKIFFLMFSVVVMIVLGLLVTNSIYLEKFYIKNKKEGLKMKKIIACVLVAVLCLALPVYA